MTWKTTLAAAALLAAPAFAAEDAAAMAAPVDAARAAEIATALAEVATYSRNVLLMEDGKGRADYYITDGEWVDYEVHWHTGQLIWGLVEAGKVLGDDSLITDARRGGDWWVSTEYPEGHPFAGLVSAAHGDKLGDLINWTTIADGTPGLFALSRVTGDPVYADTATRSGRWLWDNTRVPEGTPNGDQLFYNIFNPDTGEVYRDWDVHTQGVPRDPVRAAAEQVPITRVARPNIEGFLFHDMCRHTGETAWCDRFLDKADALIARQGEEGLWLEFEPNTADGGQVHPRFNVWNAEALLQAFEISGDRKYLDAAAKTARWAQRTMQRDGTIYYRTSVDGASNRAQVTGSAVAFNGILMMRLKDYGYTEFEDTVDTLATWIVNNRFANEHPDPNLAGAVINTRQRRSDGRNHLMQRDVGSTFAMRFLALYHRDLMGEDVNAYLNPRS